MCIVYDKSIQFWLVYKKLLNNIDKLIAIRSSLEAKKLYFHNTILISNTIQYTYVCRKISNIKSKSLVLILFT